MPFSLTFETRRAGHQTWEQVQDAHNITDPYEAEQAFADLAKEYAIAIDDYRFGGEGHLMEARVTMTVIGKED